jgi:hypothetical protein
MSPFPNTLTLGPSPGSDTDIGTGGRRDDN